MAAKKRGKVRSKIVAAVRRAGAAIQRVAKKRSAKAAKKKTPAKAKTKKHPARLGHRPVAPRSKTAKKAARKPARRAGPLREGGLAPSFTLLDDSGQMFSSHVLEGQPYVVYFYPKDDTPGCTKEACGFRDHLAELARVGVQVIGISPDSVGSHARFKDKYDLPFMLLSDDDRKTAKAFGVWVKKQRYGREYMGIERSTFLVGPDGRVQKIWRGVKVSGHVEAVLAEARARH